MTDATTWMKVTSIVGIVFVAYLAVMWLVMVSWTHRDIASRTTSRTQRVLAVTLVAFLSLPGLLLYLALRPPETSAENLIRQLEADALMQDFERLGACSGCGHSMAAEFVICPYCRTSVQSACHACERNLRTAWVLCPYCGADRPESAAPDPARSPTMPARTPALAGGSLRHAASNRM